MPGDSHYLNKSAIVLDDNPQMRSILRSILNAMGLRSVAEFSDAISARNYLQGHHVDVAVLDLVLGSDMDGLELASTIRHDPMIINPTMPIILVTGYANVAVIDQAINVGVDELVTKPLRARDLIARVEKAILRPALTFARHLAISAPTAAVARTQGMRVPKGAMSIWLTSSARRPKPAKRSSCCAPIRSSSSARLMKLLSYSTKLKRSDRRSPERTQKPRQSHPADQNDPLHRHGLRPCWFSAGSAPQRCCARAALPPILQAPSR